jgi:hypothetical protein
MSLRVIRTIVIASLVMASSLAIARGARAQIIIPAGVSIDTSGVLRLQVFPDPTGQLTNQRREAAQALLDQDLRQPSKLRKISLPRLASAIADAVKSGQPLSDEMKYLAGLTQITHVFYYPETRDIVIAGPAEGFYTDLAGRTVGLESGRATMRLDDLAVALRAFPPSGEHTRVIGCSIDPTADGLKQMAEVNDAIQPQFQPGMEGQVVEALRQALGLQLVSIEGVDPETHFAQVLVEADYRMKLIGIGLEPPPVKIRTYVEEVQPRRGNRGLVRWYFTPDYDCILVSPEEDAMQLVGEGAQLVGADELVRADGQRVRAGANDRASSNFCRSFTDRFPELADASPVFAELRNLIDLSIAAAFIQEMDYYGQAELELGALGDDDILPVSTQSPPKYVEPAINAIWKDGLFMTPIGGGVNIQPRMALTVDHMRQDEQGNVEQAQSAAAAPDLPAGRWWWD